MNFITHPGLRFYRPCALLMLLCLCLVSARGQSPAGAGAEKPSTPRPTSEQAQADYKPITGAQRIGWIAETTVGTESLLAGTFTAAWQTAFNSPKEYGPHWAGFGQRYGMRFAGVSTANSMEAGLGAIWGEDPRYASAIGKPFGARLKSVFMQTAMTRRRDGHFAPAYARFLAAPGSNFLSNTWRADSEATTGAALRRTGYAFLGQLGENAFVEFWPSLKKLVFKRK